MSKDPFALDGYEIEAKKEEKSNLPTPNNFYYLNIMRSILNINNRDKLIINHDKSANSARLILDGFGMESLVQAYADDVPDEQICSYLHIKPSQLKSWIAMSQQRISILSRLKDIKRATKVDNIIDETLDYSIGEINDKADEALEKLKLDAMKMRSKLALDLDTKTRGKDQAESPNLPVVNLGLQVLVGSDTDKTIVKTAKPVIPGVVSFENHE